MACSRLQFNQWIVPALISHGCGLMEVPDVCEKPCCSAVDKDLPLHCAADSELTISDWTVLCLMKLNISGQSLASEHSWRFDIHSNLQVSTKGREV